MSAFEEMTVEDYRQQLTSKHVNRAYLNWHGGRLYVGRRLHTLGAHNYQLDTRDGIVSVPPTEPIFVKWQVEDRPF